MAAFKARRKIDPRLVFDDRLASRRSRRGGNQAGEWRGWWTRCRRCASRERAPSSAHEGTALWKL